MLGRPAIESAVERIVPEEAVMSSIEAALRYPELSAQGFAHPADRAARAALHSIPLLDRAIKKVTELSFEKRLRQIYLGNAVRLGENQVPAVWAMQRQCAYTLDLATTPRLYVTHQPVGQALTVGTHEPITLVASGLVGSYSDEELRAVLAHEMGHVLGDHVAIITAAEIVRLVMSTALKGQPLVGIPLRALYYALMECRRAGELTCDRASALVVADPRVTCMTLMRMAGGPVRDMSLDAFIQQATEYEEEADPLARWSRFFDEANSTHPFPVRRVRELIAWVTAGDYDRIRSGQYVRRGQEPPPSAEFDAAFQHYRQRFARIVDRASSGVQTVADRFSSWLGSRGSEGAEPGDDAADDFVDEDEDS
jgi:Zn-dependent protease with chaperone function